MLNLKFLLMKKYLLYLLHLMNLLYQMNLMKHLFLIILKSLLYHLIRMYLPLLMNH
jgi:hypothetical protein